MIKVYVDSFGNVSHRSVGSQALVLGAMQIVQRRFKDVLFYIFSVQPELEKVYLGKYGFNIEYVKRPTNQYQAYRCIRKLISQSDAVISPCGDAYITLRPHLILKKSLDSQEKRCAPNAFYFIRRTI